MTPTYPKWERTTHDGIKKVTMDLWNSREDVKYYEVGVFDESWEPIPFVTLYSILKVEYLSRVQFDVYMTEKSIKKAVYICSLSKLRSNDDSKPLLATQICSKFK
jgi:hypothetical protein